MNKKVHNLYITLLWVLYVLFIGWFLWIYLSKTSDNPNNIYTNFYGVIPLLGGFYGLWLSKYWGGWNSKVGKAVILLSSGLVTWGIGMVIWLYYNIILHVDIPYPSLADAAFILSWPLWGAGAAFLSIATGAKLGMREVKGRVMLFIIPIIVITFSYFFLVTIARGGVVSDYLGFSKTFFDVAYPVGDVVILSITLLVFGLSYKYFGGIYKKAIYFILFAFVMNYFADFTFSYTTTLGTYYNGSLADALFVTTMTILSTGIILLDPKKLDHHN